MKQAIQEILKSRGLLQGGEVVARFGDAIEAITLVEYKSKNGVALRVKCDGSNDDRFIIDTVIKEALYKIPGLTIFEFGRSDKTRKGSGFMSARGQWHHAEVESTTYSFYIRLKTVA